MIGLEVMTWGTEGHESAYYYPVYRYLWGGGDMGHAALKLTLPCNAEVDAWVQQYCREGDRILIPHYQVTRNISGHDCLQWVIYFSWWPGELQEEYSDRMSANAGVNIEYAPRWRSYFTETMTERSGYLRQRFGRLYDMIFGKPKRIPKPISHIVHPSAEQERVLQDLDKLEENELIYAEQENELLESLGKIAILEQRMNYFLMRSKRLLEACFSEAEEILVKENFTKKCKKVLEQIETLSEQLDPLLDKHKKLMHELIVMRRSICEQAVSVGCQPQSIHLSLGDDLSPKNLLKAMHRIIKGPYEFDKFFYNCSTVVREIIESGLSPELQGQGGVPHFFDTPLKIRRFALELQTQLINCKLKNLVLGPSREILLQYPASIAQWPLTQECIESHKPSAINRPI